METAEEAAVRELKEETGYVGTVTETSPVMFNGLVLVPNRLFLLPPLGKKLLLIAALT